MVYRFMQVVENLLSKMYIEGALMSKSRNIALMAMLSTADRSIDDLLAMLSTADGSIDDLLAMLSTADRSTDDFLAMLSTRRCGKSKKKMMNLIIL